MKKSEIERLAAAISGAVLLAHKEILTADEAARYMGIEKSYLYKMTHDRKIPHYKPGGKNLFFRRTELEAWLTTNPVATDADLNSRVAAHCMKKRII